MHGAELASFSTQLHAIFGIFATGGTSPERPIITLHKNNTMTLSIAHIEATLQLIDRTLREAPLDSRILNSIEKRLIARPMMQRIYDALRKGHPFEGIAQVEMAINK
jgi:hypothetical protein